jgi:cation transport ATPase
MENNENNKEEKKVIILGQRAWGIIALFMFILAVLISIMVNKATNNFQWTIFSLIMLFSFIAGFRYIHLMAVLKNKKHSLFLVEFLVLVAVITHITLNAFSQSGIIKEIWGILPIITIFLLGVVYALLSVKNVKPTILGNENENTEKDNINPLESKLSTEEDIAKEISEEEKSD